MSFRRLRHPIRSCRRLTRALLLLIQPAGSSNGTEGASEEPRKEVARQKQEEVDKGRCSVEKSLEHAAVAAVEVAEGGGCPLRVLAAAAGEAED